MFLGMRTWAIQICHECIYSRPAFRHPVSDRDELRCYRDVPKEIFDRILDKVEKHPPLEIEYSGHYFVSAFHMCAGWQPVEWKQKSIEID